MLICCNCYEQATGLLKNEKRNLFYCPIAFKSVQNSMNFHACMSSANYDNQSVIVISLGYMTSKTATSSVLYSMGKYDNEKPTPALVAEGGQRKTAGFFCACK